jgi:hypothetical protein
LLEAKRLTDFLPITEGSEQRPHQKTQSMQHSTSSVVKATEPTLEDSLPKTDEEAIWSIRLGKNDSKTEKKLVLFRTYVGGSDGN